MPTAPDDGGASAGFAANAPRPREPRDAVQQRVYVGVVGLAAVFLLTLLAASIFAMLGQDSRTAVPPVAGSAAAKRLAAEEQPKEPLAELGVAPGNAPKPAAAARTTAPATPPAAARPGAL